MKKESITSIKHWTQGGNGITNFLAEDYDLYYDAIYEYGDPTLYIGEPMPPLKGKGSFALRRSSKMSDLSAFWYLFDVKREQMENKK